MATSTPTCLVDAGPLNVLVARTFRNDEGPKATLTPRLDINRSFTFLPFGGSVLPVSGRTTGQLWPRGNH